MYGSPDFRAFAIFETSPETVVYITQAATAPINSHTEDTMALKCGCLHKVEV